MWENTLCRLSLTVLKFMFVHRWITLSMINSSNILSHSVWVTRTQHSGQLRAGFILNSRGSRAQETSWVPKPTIYLSNFVLPFRQSTFKVATIFQKDWNHQSNQHSTPKMDLRTQQRDNKSESGKDSTWSGIYKGLYQTLKDIKVGIVQGSLWRTFLRQGTMTELGQAFPA